MKIFKIKKFCNIKTGHLSANTQYQPFGYGGRFLVRKTVPKWAYFSLNKIAVSGNSKLIFYITYTAILYQAVNLCKFY